MESTWKSTVKSSEKFGRTHPDTFIVSDTRNLDKGFTGAAVPVIKKIELYHDENLVYGYEIFYGNPDASTEKLFQVGHHIGGHLTPAVKMETFEL